MATRALNPRRTGPAPARPTRRATPQARTPLGAAVTRRRAIAAALAVLTLYAGYMLWFRNLALFSIDDVTVTGATTNAPAIKKAVEQVAGEMTTLHLKDDELRRRRPLPHGGIRRGD